MNAIQNFKFFDEAAAAGESNVFISHCYTDATIEIKGDATAFNVEVQACIDIETEPEWTTLCVVDESNFNTLTSLTAKGLYSFSAMGKSVRVKINSVSGGSLTIVGKFLN